MDALPLNAEPLTADLLAKAEIGMDGNTLLLNAMAAGTKTPLPNDNAQEILRQPARVLWRMP